MARKPISSRRPLKGARPAGDARGLFRRAGHKLKKPRHLSDNPEKDARAWAWMRRKSQREAPPGHLSRPDSYDYDAKNKVHSRGSVFPDHVPRHWTREDVEEVRDSLRHSLATRRAEQLRLGEHGPHREQIRREEEFLDRLEKWLSGT